MTVTSEDSVRVRAIYNLLNHWLLNVMGVEFSVFFTDVVNIFKLEVLAIHLKILPSISFATKSWFYTKHKQIFKN